MSVMVPIGFFSIPAILSDISSVESQVCIHLYTSFTSICSAEMSIYIQSRVQIVFIGGFTISNILTPLWSKY